MARMIGRAHMLCPHGRDCTDNPAPGKARKAARRYAKRSERQTWRRAEGGSEAG